MKDKLKILFLLTFTGIINAYTQNYILVFRTQSDESCFTKDTFLLKEGKKIWYSLQDNDTIFSGKINKILDSVFIVAGKTISPDSLSVLKFVTTGRKIRKAIAVISFAGAFIYSGMAYITSKKEFEENPNDLFYIPKQAIVGFYIFLAGLSGVPGLIIFPYKKKKITPGEWEIRIINSPYAKTTPRGISVVNNFCIS